MSHFVHISCANETLQSQCYKATTQSSSSLRWFLWFIKLISLHGIKLSSSQIRENGFCVLSSLSLRLQFVHLTFSRSFFPVCIFIANANELVGKSCVIKLYLQGIQIHARNATFTFSRNWMSGARYEGNMWEKTKDDDNAFCASLRTFRDRFYCQNLHLYCNVFWLITFFCSFCKT